MDKSLNKNTLFNTIKSLFSIIFPLITFPYVSRILGVANLGKINFGNSIISYVSLTATLGITNYAVRECSKVRKDATKLQEVASQLFSINIFSMIISYVWLFIALVFVRRLNDYRLLIAIQSISVIFTTLGADWMNTVFEDFKYLSIRTMCTQVLTLVLMFVLVRKPEDYIQYAAICVISSSGANLINIFYRRKYCKFKFTLNLNLSKHLKPVLLMFSMTLTQTIFCNSDITMLGLMKGNSEVGLYSVSVKFFTLISTLISSNLWVSLPQISENIEKDDWPVVNSLLAYSLNFIFVLGIPMIVGLNIIPSSIVTVISGSDYLGAIPSLRWISLALLCSFMGSWIGTLILIPQGKENICLRSSLIAAITNVVLNAFLIPKFGLNGAGFTTFLTEGLGVLIMLPYIDSKVRINGVIKMLVAPAVGAVVIACIGVLMSSLFQSSLLITCLTIAFSIIGYAFVLYIMKNEFFLSFIKKF